MSKLGHAVAAVAYGGGAWVMAKLLKAQSNRAWKRRNAAKTWDGKVTPAQMAVLERHQDWAQHMLDLSMHEYHEPDLWRDIVERVCRLLRAWERRLKRRARRREAQVQRRQWRAAMLRQGAKAPQAPKDPGDAEDAEEPRASKQPTAPETQQEAQARREREFLEELQLRQEEDADWRPYGVVYKPIAADFGEQARFLAHYLNPVRMLIRRMAFDVQISSRKDRETVDAAHQATSNLLRDCDHMETLLLPVMLTHQ